MTLSDARTYCRTHYNDLAAVETEEDYRALKKAGTTGPNGVWWIGLYDDVSSWRWSLNKSRPGFTRWASGQPDNTDGYENCVTMNISGDWNDRNCSERRAFNCYRGKNTDLIRIKPGTEPSKPCSVAAGASPSFVFVDESKTWSDARDHCRVHFTDLAPVFDQTQVQALTGIMSGPGWIGLYRASWKWTDGSEVTWIKWKPGSPSGGGCVGLETNTYLLQTFPCSRGFYFICQKSKTRSKPGPGQVLTRFRPDKCLNFG